MEAHNRAADQAALEDLEREQLEIFAEVEGEILAADCRDEEDESLITVGEDRMLEEGEMTTANNGTIVEGVQRVETNRLNVNNKEDNGKGDAAILKSLFDGKAGLHSAMCHDKILSAADSDGRAKIAFADRIARRAAEAVKRSGRGNMNGHSNVSFQTQPQQQQINATTTSTTITRTIATNNINTGRFGSNNTGSRRLFSRIQQRREEENAIITAHQDASAAANANQEEESRFAQALLKEIIQFLRSRGGAAPTGLVVDAFADKVTAERRVIFRNLLKQCARLERNPTTNDGNKAFSAWVLKPEYDK